MDSGRAWLWLVGVVLMLGLFGECANGDSATPAARETPVPTFADGSEFPPEVIEAGEICNELHPFDDGEFAVCVLQYSSRLRSGTRSSQSNSASDEVTATTRPRATTSGPATTATSSSTSSTTSTPQTTIVQTFPSDPDEPAPPTSEPVFLQTGLGIVSIGDFTQAAIEALTGFHGPPTEDTGWEPSFSSFGTCPGIEARSIWWGSLNAVFVEFEEDTELGPWVFTANSEGVLLSLLEIASREPQWNHPTWYGISVGDTIGELRNVYGSRVDVQYDPDFDHGYFGIDAGPNDDLWGRITGTATGSDPDDVIESIHVGGFCGE